ncbi:MAG: PmoA family protein [Bacteroidota bacterium]
MKNNRYPLLSYLILFIAQSSCTIYNLNIDAGEYDREETPVYFEWSGDRRYNVLIDTADNTKIRFTKVNIFDNRYQFLLEQPLPKGTIRSYRFGTAKASHSDFNAFDPKIKSDTALALQYNNRLQRPTFDAPAYYARSGFIHPLCTPSGKVLTDNFPIGHTHQNGIFHAWVNTIFRKQKVDFWNRQKETGKVQSKNENVPLGLESVTSKMQSLQDRLLHIAVDREGKEVTVLEEWQKVNFYEQAKGYLFDIQSLQRNITNDTLFVHQYHYGGMAFRASKFWNVADSVHFTNDMQIITSEGKDRLASNHTRPNWVCAYGKIEGAWAGFVVFNHPDNFRSPQFIRVHPSMPYFCFTPTVEEGFKIAPQGQYYAQYRIYTFDGQPDLEQIEYLWQDYKRIVETDIK